MGTDKHIYTVSELTKDIRAALEGTFGMVWIEGEVSNFKGQHTSGHMYFNMKDEHSVLACAMFKRVNQDLKFQVQDGIHVIAFGKVTVYEVRGQYQLIVEKIEPKGVGALQLAFEQLKEKLKKEGFFERARKKPIPYLPTRIGVVTSPTGAAIRDILNVTKRRFSNVEIILSPVNVQGRGAEKEIAEAIELFNKLDNVDVMIVGRGGGSLEDLWSFNEEVVARAIFNSRIPVISAVGHDTDWTISDFVADYRAPTPSSAAELVIPEKKKLREEVVALSERLKNALNFLSVQAAQEIDELLKEIMTKTERVISSKEYAFKSLTGKMGALNPLAILERGYSITFLEKTDTVIKDAKCLKKGDRVRTRFSKGEITSRVER